MATALSVITGAMQDARIIGVGKTPKAAESDYCLDQLNQMLHEWAINGLDLAHIDLALTDTIDLPADHISAIRANLILRLDTFGAELTPMQAKRAEDGERLLRAYHFTLSDLSSEHPLSDSSLSSTD